MPQPVVWKQNAQTELFLIATSSGVHWNLQKDLSERGDTTRERALNETQEEVGLSSTIIDETLKLYLHATGGASIARRYLPGAGYRRGRYAARKITSKKCWVNSNVARGSLGNYPICRIFLTAIECLGWTNRKST